MIEPEAQMLISWSDILTGTPSTCLLRLFVCDQAAVVGDTVGDPLKDTSGPSLNILMKLMAIISLVFAEYFQAINNGQGLFNIAS